MDNKNYVALHNHSDYSALDGYGTIDEYLQAAKDNGMIGIGLSDHGTASGLYKFITRAQKKGLIPVPGVEFYVAPENPKGAKMKAPVYYGRGGNKAPKYDISNGAYTHLTIFAYNNKGIENLFKLTSESWQIENYYFKPRIDTNMLAQHSEGLIATTGCPSSEISKRFLLGQDDKAYEYATRMKSIFGDNYYVEVMDHSMPDDELERILAPKLIKMSEDLGIEPILTNDSHYAFKEDHFPHERILALSTKTPMSTPPFHKGGTRFAFSTPEYYIKSYDEMLELFPGEFGERALANTVKITKQCEGIKLEYDPHLRPEIEIPEGYTAPTYFQKLIFEGFKAKRGDEPKEVQEESVKRIREEFEVIHSNDFISYFLVVHDYIDFAHKQGIGIGAGRGSVGGSEIAYLLDISNTDPIRFNLLFERFLSPGRGSLYQIDYMSGESEEIAVSDKKRVYSDGHGSKVVYVHELHPGDLVNFGSKKEVIKNVFVKTPGSAPDVDTDFHTEGREEVVQYIIDKYGEDKVANIITFGTFKAKSGFKAMSTAYEVPFGAANRASKMIPGGQGAEASLKDMMDPTSPRYNEGADFRQATSDELFDEVIDVATKLDGRVSETGMHPCGIIISKEPLAGIVPLQIRQPKARPHKDDGKVIAQWEYPELESLGLIKMDLLGLELVNTIQQTLENIQLANESATDKRFVREVPDMRELVKGPMDDPATYKMLQEGNSVGIFQLGSPGVRELLKRAKPTEFMDIATITALYRPGPMSMNSHLEWADRTNGVNEIVTIDEELEGTVVEDILAETAGLLIFQESLMQIAIQYAGMTPYESDSLRKAMGKKKLDLMASLHPKFVEGAVKNGSTKELAEKVWETMEGFGSYGFNKSHSVSYAINIYQTMYLKTHFPNEFMAAVIQQGFGDADKVKTYIQEAKRMNIKLGPVDINTSQVQMSSTGSDPSNEYEVVFGFNGVRNVNDTLAHAIVKERNASGPYTSVADFVKRISKRVQLTAAPLSSLALAGAFDQFGVSRRMVEEKAKMIIDSGTKQAAKGASLFDMLGGAAAVSTDIAEQIELDGVDFDYTDKIKKEAHTIGMYVSGHPTSNLGHIARMYKPVSLSSILSSGGSRETFTILATITQTKSKTNKSGNKSIAVLIDDGDETAATYLPKTIVQAMEKGEELARIQKARDEGKEVKQTNQSIKLKDVMNDDSIKPIEPIELNHPYAIKVRTRGWGESINITVVDIKKLYTAPDGSLPYEVNVMDYKLQNDINDVVGKHFDEDGAYVKLNYLDGSSTLMGSKVNLTLDFIMDMEKVVGKENIVTEDI